MQRFRSLLLVTLLSAAGGCNCLGLATYRPGPIPPLRAAALPGGSMPGALVVPPVDARLDAADWLSETRTDPGNTGAVEAGESPSSPFGALAEYRSPETAFCLACVVAGGGHLYTGETVKGVALLGVAVAGLVAGSVVSNGDDYESCEYNPETFECEPTGAGRTPLWVGVGVAAGSWIYGIIDSRASADRVNTRNGLERGPGVEAGPWFGMSRGRPSGGLSFRVKW